MDNILLLGGTGFLGSNFANYIKLQQYNISVYQLNSNQFNSNKINNINYLLQFICKNNINIIVDFTRNTYKQLLTFYFLMNKISITCKYVNISSYCVIYKNIIRNSEYINTKLKIEQYKRKNNYSIRLPIIINNFNELTKLNNDVDIIQNYYFVQTIDVCNIFLYRVIFKCLPNIYNMPAIKIFKNNI